MSKKPKLIALSTLACILILACGAFAKSALSPKLSTGHTPTRDFLESRCPNYQSPFNLEGVKELKRQPASYEEAVSLLGREGSPAYYIHDESGESHVYTWCDGQNYLEIQFFDDIHSDIVQWNTEQPVHLMDTSNF